MAIMIDTNILLDVLLKREPFVKEAKEILEACARKEVEGVFTTSAVTDIFYIEGKEMDDIHILYLLMEDLFGIVRLYNVRKGDIMAALDQKEQDFEDCLLSVCAQRAGCDRIVTRNTKDFQRSFVKAVEPKEFLNELSENRLQ